MKLIVDEGEYESPTLCGLIWLVVKHRFWHWRRGDGFTD